MTEETLDGSLTLLQAAGFRARDLAAYKMLLAKSFQHLNDDYWVQAVEECINTRTLSGMPKIAEWKGYVRTVYDRMPKIGRDPEARAAEEHHQPTPTEKHVAAWRKMFGGPINFDQAPELVLADIMAAFRTKKLLVSKLASFFCRVPTEERGVPTALLTMATPAPAPNEARRKNELVRALVEAPPIKEEQAEGEASVGSPSADVVEVGNSPTPPRPEAPQYSEEDLRDVPF